MAMSLDYLGKLIIILIVVGVAIGMIMNFSNQVDETSPDLPGGDDPGLEIAQVSGGHSNAVSKVSRLIQLCHQRSLEKRYEDLKCFVARKESGAFNIDSSELRNNLNEETADATEFRQSTYSQSSITIMYRSRPQQVVVD